MTTGLPTRPSARRIVWRRGVSALLAYEADVEGQRWAVRVNDFPAQVLYTLLINGDPAEELDAWPDAWERPS